MKSGKEKTIVTKNGIRIIGDVSAFSQYGQDGQPNYIAAKKEIIVKEKKHTKKKEKNQVKKAPKQKVSRAEETEAERMRKVAVQKRIAKLHQGMTKTKPTHRSSFKVMQKVNWTLDWNYVMFKDGYIVIYAHSASNVRFSPLKTYVTDSLESFNYLKKYLNDRLPPVRCEIEQMKLKIIDKISFDEAIQRFAIAARQAVIKVNRNGSKTVGLPHNMSFNQALSKARQMTPEDFRKYKSQYIDYLVSLQSEKYKVIPCVERMAHANSDSTEYAFMFSIECRSGKILIVHENVNPDRSTLLFLVKEDDFNKSIREIYDFLQSAEINKRSSLRDRSIAIKNVGIQSYRSINHDELYSWKSSITAYKYYR